MGLCKSSKRCNTFSISYRKVEKHDDKVHDLLIVSRFCKRFHKAAYSEFASTQLPKPRSSFWIRSVHLLWQKCSLTTISYSTPHWQARRCSKELVLSEDSSFGQPTVYFCVCPAPQQQAVPLPTTYHF